MLRNLGSKLAPRLTPSVAACLQETQCGIHTSTSQWGVGIPERKVEATDPAGKTLFLPGCCGLVNTVFNVLFKRV